MRITRLTRKELDIYITARAISGGVEFIDGVQVALMDRNVAPNEATVWVDAFNYSAGIATIILAGPDAVDTDALVVPAEGADLYVKCLFGEEVEVERVLRITVEDSTA